MHNMYNKLAAIALAVGLSANLAHAGNLSDPVVTPDLIVAETIKSSNDDWVLPLMALILFAAAASN